MRRITVSLIVVFLLAVSTLSLIQVARGQGPGEPVKPVVVTREVQGENVREVTAPTQVNAPQMPSISYIDSPTGTCYQPDPGVDACYLNWYYMSVNAGASSYMITMTVTLNNYGPLAHMQGFFQQSMYAPYNMFGRGFKVACGAPGAGGNPQLGNAYAWAIRARASDGLASANYGTSYCPAYKP